MKILDVINKGTIITHVNFLEKAPQAITTLSKMILEMIPKLINS